MAAGGRAYPGEAVEVGGFPGAVGADDGGHLSFRHQQVHRVDGAGDVDLDAITFVEEDDELFQNLAREADAVAEEWPVEDR